MWLSNLAFRFESARRTLASSRTCILQSISSFQLSDVGVRVSTKSDLNALREIVLARISCLGAAFFFGYLAV